MTYTIAKASIIVTVSYRQLPFITYVNAHSRTGILPKSFASKKLQFVIKIYPESNRHVMEM